MRVSAYFLILFCLSAPPVFAQQDNYGWRIGVGGGYMNYYGDVSNYSLQSLGDAGNALNLWTLDTRGVNPESVQSRQSPLSAFSLTLERKITSTTGFIFQYSNGYITANDRLDLRGGLNVANPNFARALNFRTNLHDYSIGFSFATDNDRILRATAFFAPYFTLNVGYTQFAAKGDLLDANGNRYAYNPDGTLQNGMVQDGRFETDLRNLNTNRATYDNGTINVGLGLGLKFRLSPAISLHVQSDVRHTFTDYLDDVGSDYRPTYDNGFSAYAANPTGVSRPVRGNSQPHDIFAYHSLSVRFSFGKTRKRDVYRSPAFTIKDVPYEQFIRDTASPAADLADKKAMARKVSLKKDSLATAGLALSNDTISADTVEKNRVKPDSSYRTRAPENETLVILNNGKVEEVRIRNGNVTIRNYEADRRDSVSAGGAAYPDDSARAARQADTKKIVSPGKAKPATPKGNKTDRQKTPATDTAANVQPSGISETDSARSRLNSKIIRLQAKINEMEKRLDDTLATEQKSKPAAQNTRRDFERDFAYRADTRRIDSLRRQLDEQESGKEKKSFSKNIFRKKNKKAQDSLGQRPSEREQAMREINRLNNQIEQRRAEAQLASQPQPVAGKDRDEYAKNLRELNQYTQEMRQMLDQERRANENLRLQNQQYRTDNQGLRNQSPRRAATDNLNLNSPYRYRDEPQQPSPGRRTAVPVTVAPVIAGSPRQADTQTQDRLAQNEAKIQRLTRQLDSLQAARDITAKRDTLTKTTAENPQINALQDSLASLRNLIQSLKSQPVASKTPEKPVLDVVAMPATSVYFAVGSVALSPDGMKKTAKVAALLKKYPETQLQLTGMADATGNAAANRKLSLRRAQAIRNVLVGRYKLSPERITVESVGTGMASGKKNALDRRVEMTFE